VSAPQNLMNRLEAANPVADSEAGSPEQQREVDALLERLLATPVEAPLAQAGSRRRWPQLAGVTALVAVAVFAALSLLDSDDGRAPNVVAKAVAALTDEDAVYHAVLTAHAQGSDVPDARFSPLFESWHTSGGRMHERTYLDKNGRRGRLVADFAGQRRPGRLGGPALSWDSRSNEIYEMGFGRVRNYKGAPTVDPFAPGRGLRELQAEGRLRVAGEVEVDGRRAYRLVSGRLRGRGGTVESSVIVVDAETYLPRLQRLFVRAPNDETWRIVWRYRVYERLPLNDRTSALLDFDPPAGAKCRPGSDHLIRRKGSLGFPNPCAK
jgi:hypothetical protein